MKPMLLVDGYNIIGAWRQAEKEDWPIDESRDRLCHMLEDYAGYTGQEVVVVFDGYRQDRRTSSVDAKTAITLVYTKHGETADQYIERLCGQIPPYRTVRVATSDQIEQTLILGRGATRLSARELLTELKSERLRGRDKHIAPHAERRTSIFSALPKEQRDRLEAIRRSADTKPT